MKLIIDIPEDALKEMKTEDFISIESLDTAIECIKNGIPLDDIKAEIEDCSFDHYFEYGEYIGENPIQHRICMTDKVLDVLDNIGKAESEDKNESI